MIMPRGPSTPYAPGTRFQHVTVIDRVAPVEDVQKTRYLVRYHCCGREGVLSHGHLYYLLHSSHRKAQPITGCRVCSPTLRAEEPAPLAEVIPVGTLWPIPPSLAPRRALATPRRKSRARAARA